MNDRPDIPGYELRRELGHGGMATVYLARQQSLDREVAIKVMAAALNADREFSARFLAEARTAARLSHPGIVSVHDMGVAGHHHYIAMEHISGGDLKDRLRQGAIKPAEAVGLLRRLASALAYAHEEGFVHRDVKPENILFRKDASPVLSDFGIARAIGSGTRMTATGLSIGTPHYMSPEQARGHAVDGRSDLYALGVVFFEMLTGQVPFDAQDSFAVGLQHINDPVPELRPMLAKYQPVIDRLLAKNSEDRYQNGAELIEDLDRIEKGERLKSGRAGTRLVKKVSGKAEDEDHGSKDLDRGSRITDHGKGRESGSSSRAGVYWGLGGAAVAVVLAIGMYLWQDQPRSTPSIGGGTTIVSRPATERIEPLDLESPTPESRTLKPEPLPSGNSILHITTTPAGAAVYLGEHRLGQTPFQSDELPEGEHRLRLDHRHYEPWEQTVRLEDDVVERIEANLQRGTGRVTVITEPPGAEVWVDGQPAEGTTPVTISELLSGDQSLEIRLTRYRTETHEVEILPRETARLDIALQGGDLHEWEGRWLTGDEVISYLLEAAEADLAATRLMQPEDDNAWDKFQQVLTIRPGNTEATQGIKRIAERYVELAEGALNNNQLDRAANFLANARTTGAEGSRFDRATNRLQQAQDQQRAEQRRRQLITDIQRELARLGRDIEANGSLNSTTREAIRSFERGTNRPEAGEATNQLLAALRSAESWPAPPINKEREQPPASREGRLLAQMTADAHEFNREFMLLTMTASQVVNSGTRRLADLQKRHQIGEIGRNILDRQIMIARGDWKILSESIDFGEQELKKLQNSGRRFANDFPEKNINELDAEITKIETQLQELETLASRLKGAIEGADVK